MASLNQRHQQAFVMQMCRSSQSKLYLTFTPAAGTTPTQGELKHPRVVSR